MKKYIAKSLLLLAIGALALSQTSCKDLLDQEPQGNWTESDNPGGRFQSDIYSLYAKLRHEHVSAGLVPLAIQGFRSQDAEKGSTGIDGSKHAEMYDDFNYTASNNYLTLYWNHTYSLVHTANKVIDGVKKLEEAGQTLTDDDKVNRAEAHFIRAFAYFNLVRAFGDIPKIDFMITDALEANKPKSPASEIYALIDADLTKAYQGLPAQWESRFIGRLTKWAARALHARTYMMRNDWANMYAASMEVINSNQFNLSTPFDKIFRETSENGPESVFELQCTATDALSSDEGIGSRYAQVQGVRGQGQWNLGWGWHTPTQILADAFEPNDPRKDETLLYFVKQGDDPTTIQANKPYSEKPVAQADVINKYYNKKVYTDPDLRKKYAQDGFWFNIRIIRFADVVLMAAESANELSKTSEALDYLERVRARARGGNSAVLPKVTTTDQEKLRQAIRHERRIELAMEWDHFYDLVRWGTAQQVLHAAGKTNYQSKHSLLPIPQTEIDKSNGVLVQNPNY